MSAPGEQYILNLLFCLNAGFTKSADYDYAYEYVPGPCVKPNGKQKKGKKICSV